MRILYFDCFAGISGDMTLAALTDLAVPPEYLIGELNKLNVGGWSLSFERRDKNGVSANYAVVTLGEHAHEHEHEHDHNSYAEIAALINESGITDGAKALALKIFAVIAEAEGKVHGVPAADVHFHEVGALDSVIDVVGAAVCVDYIKPDAIYFSEINEGRGFTWCRHGKIPIPVPATAEIFASANVPFRQIDADKELVTPTGAGIVAALANGFGLPDGFAAESVGYGAGTRDLDIPNVLRVMSGEAGVNGEYERDVVSVIERNIDDCPPEVLAYAAEKLLTEGALDVWFRPVQMKKGRPAVTLSVICPPYKAEELSGVIFKETTAIGVRIREERRVKLRREEGVVETRFGGMKVKAVAIGGAVRVYPEFEDAKRLAKEHDIPLIDLYMGEWV